MDGFALRAEDVASAQPNHPVTLQVVGDIPAGEVFAGKLQAGQAVRIMTGAQVPDGADAVVAVENTDFHDHAPGSRFPGSVGLYHPLVRGENVRPAGMDVQVGEEVIPSGEVLRPQHLGLLHMLGYAQVDIHRPPRVAVLSSGNELLPVSVPLQAAKIHDANSVMLRSQVQKYGGEPIDLGIASDDLAAIRERLDAAVDARVDLILSSAGVSVGAFDYVRSVVESGGRLDFWRVNMRPGKPVACGEYKGLPFIGLPGNPVSAFVSFEVFVRPALLSMLGQKAWAPNYLKAILLDEIESDGREAYLRCVVETRQGQLWARLTGHQGSGNLRSLVQANALLLIPSGVKYAPSGSQVDVWLLDHLPRLDNFTQE